MMSARRLTRGLGSSLVAVLGVVALCVGVLLGFCGGVAQAEAPRLISCGSFPARIPVGVAVDQSSGEVYVVVVFRPNVKEFDVVGKLVLPLWPFGEGALSAMGANLSSGDVDEQWNISCVVVGRSLISWI